MTVRRSLAALALAGATAVTLAGCGGDDGDADASSTTSSTTEVAPVAETPTAAELGAVLVRAVDPNLPVEEKVRTVENGEQAPELFDVMARSQQETGATLEVVDPVLPGYAPDTALATVTLTLPEQQPQTIADVEFIRIDGEWRLSRTWACTLVSNVAPDRVPPMCLPDGGQPPAPAPEGEPPVEPPAPEAPAPEAPAPEG